MYASQTKRGGKAKRPEIIISRITEAFFRHPVSAHCSQPDKHELIRFAVRKYRTFRRLSWDQRLQRGRDIIVPATLNTAPRLWRIAVFLVLLPMYLPLAAAFAALGFQFAPAWVFKSFGPSIQLPSILLRAERVGLLEKKKWVFLTRVKNVPNRALVEYWRSSFTIINSRFLSFILQPLTFMPFSAGQAKCYPKWKFVLHGARTVMSDRAAYEVNRRYEARYGNQSVITLTDEHQAAGQRALRNLGVPPGSWWVTLHAREHSTKLDFVHDERNADIRGHFKALEFIVNQGGWVIRVGDPSMTPLPKLDGVVDYVHTDAYADWMDLFLHAHCRFQLGSDSGANLLPNLFGRPLAAVNWDPVVGNLEPDSSSMLYIQKMLRNARDGRMLTFAEIYEHGLGYGAPPIGYKRLGLELVDNTPEEILEITKEMFERLDGTVHYTEEDECLQTHFLIVYMLQKIYPARTLSRVGRDFARRHKHLLISQGAAPTQPLPLSSPLPIWGPAERG